MSLHPSRSVALGALVLLGGLLTGGCGAGGQGDAGPDGPRLVVLYATCTLSPAFLSPYADGEDVPWTPNLQRFAERSTVFDRHETEAGQSGIAFASIFTGTQADRHGVYHHPAHLPEERYCIGEAFADAGYETWFWSGQAMASAELGYGQGVPPERVFSTFVRFTKQAKALPEGFFPSTTATGAELDRVLATLREDPARRAFLQVNFTITHELYHEYADLETIAAFRRDYPEHATPYTPEEIAETLRFFEEHRHVLQLDHPRAVSELGLTSADVQRLDEVLRLAYRACVRQLDDYFGRFVAKLEEAGLLEASLIAFTADHGETFYEEGEPLHWMHGLQLAPSVLSVPWILFGPSVGVPAARHAPVTRSIDVYPTLAGLAGLPALPDAERGGPDGVDLTPVLRGERPAQDLLAFAHTSTLGPDRIARYRKNGYGVALGILPEAHPKYLWTRVRDGDQVWELRPVPGREGETEVRCFDLATDPERRHDLFDPSDARHAERAGELARYREALVRGFEPQAQMSQRETLRRLEGLGYVGEDE